MGSADGEEPGRRLGDGRNQAGQQVMTAGRRRAAGIYGAIITAAIIAAVGGNLPTLALAVSVLVTLVVYWVAEEYAELLGEQVTEGHLPTWAYIRAALAHTWPMVSASYLPLLALVLARLAGASASTAANYGLAAAVLLLTFHGWSAAARPTSVAGSWPASPRSPPRSGW